VDSWFRQETEARRLPFIDIYRFIYCLSSAQSSDTSGLRALSKESKNAHICKFSNFPSTEDDFKSARVDIFVYANSRTFPHIIIIHNWLIMLIMRPREVLSESWCESLDATGSQAHSQLHLVSCTLTPYLHSLCHGLPVPPLANLPRARRTDTSSTEL
jgi:hypothetical protein